MIPRGGRREPMITLKISLRGSARARAPIAVLMRNRFALIARALFLVGTVSCDVELNRAYEEFFALPESEQMNVLATLSSDARLELFLYGMRMHEPPEVYLAGILARRDGQMTPEIAGRLAAGPADWETEALLYLLGLIACESEVELDGEVVRVAKESFAEIEHEELGRDAANSIRGLDGDNCPLRED
jgi:hypothetical protein